MNVLFIEDDRMNRRVVRDMLDVAGVGMVEAENAEAGLAAIDAETFDMLLIDLRMPGMDGITAIGHIRARPDDKANVPIIVITADTALDLRERCLAAGANEVLFKPVAMDALFEAMGRIRHRIPAARRSAKPHRCRWRPTTAWAGSGCLLPRSGRVFRRGRSCRPAPSPRSPRLRD